MSRSAGTGVSDSADASVVVGALVSSELNGTNVGKVGCRLGALVSLPLRGVNVAPPLSGAPVRLGTALPPERVHCLKLPFSRATSSVTGLPSQSSANRIARLLGSTFLVTTPA